ncbi:hypothetical protein GCM10007421_25300 [Halopseudomonas oceani]|uniref:Uncharacterized protein n=1 Tax=Halopseudomonas oceani TaxID=1708783 RepID=A0A2P4EU36_9GAMM|nr:hypothetical protein [Halopseudomonas oceani]POB02948.1 hypothetical protein C1949_11230 [Halopseudomonas oceani]GGE49915.1 hypothetical protein GCM10007421_25300 [Halopseudomonas oceani]
MNRRDIKKAHEQSVIRSFKHYLERAGRTLSIVGYPDPPDAVVVLDGTPSWIEITDAFIGADFARSLTSFAADDVEYIPVGRGVALNPDESFIEEVVAVVEKKYAKASITEVFESSGAGILLVGLYSPFVFEREVEHIVGVLSAIRQQHDDRFSELYVYNAAHDFFPVP